MKYLSQSAKFDESCPVFLGALGPPTAKQLPSEVASYIY